MNSDMSSPQGANFRTGFLAKRISISLGALVAIGFLSLLLIASNILLVLKNRTVAKQLRTEITSYNAANFAPAGQFLPILSGFDLSGGLFKVDPSASGQFLLLLFDPACGACDENWPNWEALLGDQITRNRAGVLFVSTSVVPKEYADGHRLNRFPAMFGLDNALVARYQLRTTPQTVLVRRGQIVQSWGGVLSKAAIADIGEVLSMNSE